MKTLLALLLTALSCHAQYATLVCRAYQNGMIVTNSMAVLEVAAGKVIEITDWRTYGSATNIHMRVAQQVGLWVVGSTNYPTNVAFDLTPATWRTPGTSATLTLAGPVSLRFDATLATDMSLPFFLLSYRTFDQPGVSLTVPSTAVVIPSDEQGPVSVVMESSVDLVSWGSAQPGTYSATTAARFFRVRAIRK